MSKLTNMMRLRHLIELMNDKIYDYLQDNFGDQIYILADPKSAAKHYEQFLDDLSNRCIKIDELLDVIEEQYIDKAKTPKITISINDKNKSDKANETE